MACRIGWTRLKAARAPPTMIESLPCSSVLTLPETGASSICAPRAATCVARSALTAGLTVLMSTYTFPCASPASSPAGPSVIARSAPVSRTMLNVTSAARATAAGVSPHCIPASTSHSALALVRLYPTTMCPASSSRLTMRLPMTPRPTNPRWANRLAPPPSGNCGGLFGRSIGRRGNHVLDVPLHPRQVLLHPPPRPLDITARDGIENQPMLFDGALRAPGDVVDRRQRPLQQVPHGLHHAQGDAVARGGGDRQVEPQVRLDVPVLRRQALDHLDDGPLHLRQVFIGPAGGGERGGLSLQDLAHLKEFAQVGLAQREEQVQGVVEWIGKLRDHQHALTRRFDQAVGLKHAQRFPHRGAAHMVDLRQFAFGREGVAGTQPALADVLQEELRDELVDGPPFDRFVHAPRLQTFPAGCVSDQQIVCLKALVSRQAQPPPPGEAATAGATRRPV